MKTATPLWLFYFLTLPLLGLSQMDYTLIENDMNLGGKKYEVSEYKLISQSSPKKYLSQQWVFNEYGQVVEHIYYVRSTEKKANCLHRKVISYDQDQQILREETSIAEPAIPYPRSKRQKLQLEKKRKMVSWKKAYMTIDYQYDTYGEVVGLEYDYSEKEEHYTRTFENHYNNDDQLIKRYEISEFKTRLIDSFHVVNDSIFHYKNEIITVQNGQRTPIQWPLWRATYYHPVREKRVIFQRFGTVPPQVTKYNEDGLPMVTTSTTGNSAQYDYDAQNRLVRTRFYKNGTLFSTTLYEYRSLE